nr:hypothetical protein [uncultured Desulfobulbus sp.]
MSSCQVSLIAALLSTLAFTSVHASSLMSQHSIGKDDLRHTDEAQILKKLQADIRELKEDYNRAQSQAGKESIRQSARAIKNSAEYQGALNAIKTLMKKTITCYGSMCDDPDWKQYAVNRLLQNPSLTHCYYNKSLNAVCQRHRPLKDVVLEREEQETKKPKQPQNVPNNSGLPSTIGGLIPGGGSNYGCPIPYRENANINKPYWGVIPGPLGTAKSFSCGVCDSNWNYKPLKSSYCQAPYPGNR